MARNRVFKDGDHLSILVPIGTVSGAPVMMEDLPGVALISRDAGDGKATVQFNGAFRLPVEATSGAIGGGDIVYYHDGATPVLNNTAAGGKRFGYALEDVAGAATADIVVKVGY